MKKTIIGGVAAVALAAVAGVATAQPTPQPGAERARVLRGDADNDGRISQAEFMDGHLARLSAADADRDGSVSRAEMQAVMQARRAERADQRFAKLDANGDGSISRAEFDAGHAARPERGARAERAGRGGRHAMRAGHRLQGPRAQAERGPVVIADVRTKMTERFAKLDANSDGFVTAEEQRAARMAHREQRRETRRMRQPASPAPASE